MAHTNTKQNTTLFDEIGLQMAGILSLKVANKHIEVNKLWRGLKIGLARIERLVIRLGKGQLRLSLPHTGLGLERGQPHPSLTGGEICSPQLLSVPWRYPSHK